MHMGNAKRVDDLTAQDFEHSRIWRVEVSEAELVTPVQYENLEDDEPDVALTSYVLSDGTKMNGFCTIYDCTGHVVFDAQGQPVPLTEENTCTPEEAAAAAKELGRLVEQVFPVHFQVTVKVFGRYPKGYITMENGRIIVP